MSILKEKNPNSRFKIINIEEENDILNNLFDIFGFKKHEKFDISGKTGKDTWKNNTRIRF